MNLSEIKKQLGVETLALNTATNLDGTATDWMRSWDNDNRIAVSIHKDLVAELKADPTISSLGIQVETKNTDMGPYTAKRIVKYTEAEVTL